MGFPNGSPSGRARLAVERLEDRTTPTTLGDPLGLTIPGLVASGAVAGDRVTVVMSAEANTASDAAALAAPAFARGVESLGFGIYSVTLAPGTDLGTATVFYGSLAGVASAAPDEIVRLQRAPNDPSYASLSGLTRIGAPAAWDTTTGGSFVVAVIDTGVDYNHPDLAANMWRNPNETAGDGIDNDGNGFIDDIYGADFANDDGNPLDDNNHGTHVAGTIGAVGDNGIGVAGVNWSVKIMALKFLDADGSGYTSDAIRALDYAVAHGVKVSNNSWGGGGYSGSLAAAVGRARAAGHIFVAAAGNESQNIDTTPSYPASYIQNYDNVVTVAATNSSDALASFSNYGASSVTLAAPGVSVLSTTPNNTYSRLSGTSMATPHVAGAIALYWGANPTLSYTQVIAKLKSSVDVVSGLSGKVSTGGRLNVANMFASTSPPVTPPVSPPPPVPGQAPPPAPEPAPVLTPAPAPPVPTSPPSVVPSVVVNAPVGTEVVRVLGPGGVTKLTLTPHAGFRGGIVAAAGDVTGDGVADVITAATFGGHVKVFDGATGAELRSFYGFVGYTGAINLATGDLTGDGVADVIVAANLNGHVKVFDGITGALAFSALVYDGYFGPIAVAAADIDGDGRNELITAGDGGAGVHVKAFAAGTQNLRDSFLATGPGGGTGFSISAGDLNGDRVAEFLVSQGPRVRVLDAATKAVRSDFFAFDGASRSRVTVQAGQYDGDTVAELIAIEEVLGRSQVKVFDGPNFGLIDSFFADAR